MLQNPAPPTETDLGSSPLHDECKQTILRRISDVRRGRQCTASVYARRQSLKASEPDGGEPRGCESSQTRPRCRSGRARFAVTYSLALS